jgi:hypothetical protein
MVCFRHSPQPECRRESIVKRPTLICCRLFWLQTPPPDIRSEYFHSPCLSLSLSSNYATGRVCYNALCKLAGERDGGGGGYWNKLRQKKACLLCIFQYIILWSGPYLPKRPVYRILIKQSATVMKKKKLTSASRLSKQKK